MFDSTTRSLLQRFVERARRLLEDEFTRQLRGVYGMDPESGAVAEMAALAHLSDAERDAALLLRETLAHYRPAHADDRAALERILREQSFTVLNRLAALRLAEARGSLMPCVSAGYSSQGFQLYAQLAGQALGETYGAYRAYLFALADELAEALPALFDRFAPQGRLFPGETALLDVLRLLNAPELTPLWDADETVGWIYQYFNSADERRAMRKASAAPRTSRELAVRNQFFTPRYVVEFLVDECFPSPLPSQRGGGWGEGRGKIRNPRTLLLLDPACGSMHFGLYAFDVLLRRYEEAWDAEAAGATLVDADGAPTPPLHAEFADRDAFVRAAPKLIVENNICGVDIDPRAAQIAAAALWLRAQRAWHEAGVRSAARPRVGRGRVVAAVAPPHDPALQAQFEARLGEDDRRRFAAVLALLRGLPELGLLLRAEVEIERAMRTAGGQDLPIFNEYEDWAAAEARIMQALRDYAGAAGYRARLFVGDALDCLRLIDLARERYDAVVMNPPFGEAAAGTRKRLERDYPNSKQDLLAMFVERGLELLRPGGRLGAITSRTGFFLSSFERWRREVVRKKSQPRVLADLGHGVMDGAMVEAAAYVLQKSAAVIPNASPGEAEGPLLLCLRLLHERDKAAALADVRARLADGERDPRAFSVNPASFDAVPGAPFAYWVSDAVRGLFKTLPPFESDGRTAKQGLATADDFRFLRLWWEAPADEHGARWFPFAKGGAYSPFYADLHLVVNWAEGGRELDAFAGSVIRNPHYYFRPGLTWPLRASAFAPSVLPAGSVFSVRGYAAFIPGENVLSSVALMNSASFDFIFKCALGRFGYPEFIIGILQKVPWPQMADNSATTLAHIALKIWTRRFRQSSIYETQHSFILPVSLRDRQTGWYPEAYATEITGLQSAIDDIAFDLYGFSPADRAAAEEALRRPSAPVDAAVLEADGEAADEPADDAADEAADEADTADAAADLLGWAVGVAFGRFDIRLATGERAAPPEPDPFDPLPPRSPGMLPPGDAPFHRHDGLLVDDPGHWHDLARLVEEVLERAGLPVPDDVRARLRKSFFEQHLKRYSRSRRKAPIYWPLSSPSGEYTLWLYWPRLSSQTLYAALNDFLRPAIALAEEELANLTPGPSPFGRGVVRTRVSSSSESEGHKTPLSSQRRGAGGEVRAGGERLRARLDDLLALQQSILALVDRYRPHPDDGVQISAAPLWALFRHKPWQKILKDTWSKLEKGQYDWAHLAMHTWPERVTKKCESDKSLAIAHGVGR